MKEKLELIQKHLEIVFDKVTIECDSSPEIRIIIEQNEQRILRVWHKITHAKALETADVKQVSISLALDIMSEFIYKGIK